MINSALYQQEDTIVALATSQGRGGAIAVIRMSGPQAIEIANRVFQGKDLSQQATHTVHFGKILSRDGEIIDEVLLTLFVGPRSYTKEHSVEIAVHNSPYIINKVIERVIQEGARAAEPGEFTMRAFLNGGLDLSQAEAVADLIASENKASHTLAMNQMRGGISSKLQGMRDQLIDFAALLELELDFGEEDVEFADRTAFKSLVAEIKAHLSQLIDSFAYGNAIKNGVPIAILGKPNAGKSTLLNALLDEERAIVSDIAGTTRDTIEEAITLDGITFRFIDTAGLRETSDTVEAIGVVRAKERAKKAHVVLYVYDEGDTSVEEVVSQIHDLYTEGVQILLIKNKIDLLEDGSGAAVASGHVLTPFDQALMDELVPDYCSALLPISAKQKHSVDKLKAMLVEQIRGMVSDDQQVVTNVRHLDALQQALNALDEVEAGFEMDLTGDLLAQHVRIALRQISSITGDIDVDRDILGTIFGKFCIGK